MLFLVLESLTYAEEAAPGFTLMEIWEHSGAIARAVIGRPKLLLGDEPTGNVDDRIAMRLMHLFQELNRLGTTVVVATHNRSLADRIGCPRLRMEHGRLWTEQPEARAPAIEGAA